MKYLKYLILESLSPDVIYDKYYKDLSISIFDRIVSADPTSKVSESGEIIKVGRYSKWMLKLYKADNLLLEDLYKFKRSLHLFHLLNIKGILKRKKIPTDINYYKGLPELWSNIKEYYDDNNSEILKISNKEYELFWETKDCKVIIPLTHAASCYFGTDSDWCTASDSSKYYDQYSKESPLFIIIDKHDTSVKYQFHLYSNSFADIDDSMLSSYDIIEILMEYGLYDNEFVAEVFSRNEKLKSEDMRVTIGDLTYYKKDNKWYLKFSSWTSFHDYIYSVDMGYDYIYKLLDDDLIDQLFTYELSVEDLDDLNVSAEVLEKIVDILETAYPKTMKNKRVVSNLDALKLKNYKNLSLADLSKFLTRIENELDHHDKDVDIDVLYSINDSLGDAYNEQYAIKLHNYYRTYLINAISSHYDFYGEPEYSDATESYSVPLRNFDLIDVFVNSVSDSDEEPDTVLFDPLDDPAIDIDSDDLSYAIIEHLNNI